MVNEDIVKYFKEGKNRGYGIELLKGKLVEDGVSESEINEAIKSAESMEMDKHSSKENISKPAEENLERVLPPLPKPPKYDEIVKEEPKKLNRTEMLKKKVQPKISHKKINKLLKKEEKKKRRKEEKKNKQNSEKLKKEKSNIKTQKSVSKKRRPSEYNRFVKKQMDAGKTMSQAAAFWKEHKKENPEVMKETKLVESEVKEIDRKINKKLESRTLRIEKDIAMDFAGKVQQKFDRLVKASVLFGSQTDAKGDAAEGSDIDIVLIVDDVATNWDLELVSWYREELAKLVAKDKHGSDLHINTVRLSTWWEDLLYGDPVVINILRYGEALIDYGGFFNPLKALLLKGKIRSTPEAVYAALRRAPDHIVRSRVAEMSAVEGVYWAIIDSAQAALMTAGKIPPSPEHIPEMLKEVFVDAGMLKINYIKSLREITLLHKAIVHGQVSNIKGQQIDDMQELAEKFMLEMTRIIDGILESQMKK